MEKLKHKYLLILILIFLSCTNTKLKLKESIGFSPWADSLLNNKLQTIKLSNKDTVIKLFGSKSLIILENSFIDNNGIFPQKIELSFLTLNDIDEFLMAGLPTISDKGILESNGMIYIFASDEKKNELTISPTRPIILSDNSKKGDSFLLYRLSEINEKPVWVNPIKSMMIDVQGNMDTSLFRYDYYKSIKLSDYIARKKLQKLGLTNREIDSLLINHLAEKVRWEGRFIINNFFNIRHFGWINCDRLISAQEKKVKVEVVLNSTKSVQNDVYLVFKKRKTVQKLSNNGLNKYYLNDNFNVEGYLPEDDEYKVVAIQYSVDRFFVGVSELNLNSATIIDTKQIKKEDFSSFLNAQLKIKK